MAGKLAKLLEQESEHQWLAIAVFFLFVFFGAFAIGATEHFVGASVVNPEEAYNGAYVTNIAYQQSSDAYTALVYSPNSGYNFFTQSIDDEELKLIYSPATVDLGAEVQFLKSMPNGEILFSVADNQVIGLNGEVMVYYDYPDDHGVFSILDVAEQGSKENTQRLLLTKEGGNTTFRGINGMMPTYAMSTSVGVQWQHVEAFSEGLWIATGTHISTAGADGSSPATPQARPVIGWIAWQGDAQTPVVQQVNVFDVGTLNSIALSEGTAVIGGSSGSLIVADVNDIQIINIPCSMVVADSFGKVWFIGQLGSNTISTWQDGEVNTHVLGRQLPVEVSAAGAQGGFLHVHGTDANGDPIQWTIDIKANGSIESGRGFLNLLYLMAGTVILALMLRFAAKEWKLQQ